MLLEANQKVGPYELRSVLGRGAFGEVWLARHCNLDHECALKIPTDPQYLWQLRRESHIIHRLEHENIVRGLDANTDSDPPYVAMEYIAGLSLRQKLKNGKLPPSEAISILRQALAALAYAHDRKVIHRDLKPENILIDIHGKVKVTDFGLGKVQPVVSSQSIVLSASIASNDGHSVVGSLEYMSKQQQVGEAADTRDDLYAMGVIACELFTNSRPLQGVAVTKMLSKAGVDARFARPLEKALEPEREDRYERAEQMLEEVSRLAAHADGVEAVVDRSTTPASPPPPSSLLGRWRRSLAENREQVRESKIDALRPRLARELNGKDFRAALKTVGEMLEIQPTDAEALDHREFISRRLTELVPAYGIRFRRVEAGKFVMGSHVDERGRKENELNHEVTIVQAFYIAETPVTTEQWCAVMDNNPSRFKGRDHPIEQVSWEDAVAFCRRLSSQSKPERNRYRLPTEAEWEYACRAGTRTAFNTGISLGADQANYKSIGIDDGSDGSYSGSTTPVHRFQPNSWGLFDMHGNVWEWCAEGCASHNVSRLSGRNSQTSRVLRGGSWRSLAEDCRSARRRSPRTADYRSSDCGFRLCLDLW